MAVATDAKVAGLPDLDDLLQCPVCYEVPSGHIYQCNQGHHVCGSCKLRISVCPVCRSLFFGTRNYAMEELIANFKKFKMCKGLVPGGSRTSESTESADTSLAAADTSVTLESSANQPREQWAPLRLSCSGLFRCLCCKAGTGERLPMARMLNHLRYWHALDLIEGKSEGGEYVQAWQFPTTEVGRIVTALRIADLGIFFLVIEITKENLFAWVSMAATPWVALDYCYILTISGDDREAVFSDCVWSTRSCEGQLKKRLRCLSVSGADLRALVASRVVSSRLTIKRASAGGGPPAGPRAVLRVAYRGDSDHSDDEWGPHEPTVVSAVSQRSEASASAAPAPPQPAAAPSQPAAPSPLSRNARRRMRRRLNHEVLPDVIAPNDSVRSTVPQAPIGVSRAQVGYAVTHRGAVSDPAVATGGLTAANTGRAVAAGVSNAAAFSGAAAASQSSGESSRPSPAEPRRHNNRKGRR